LLRRALALRKRAAAAARAAWRRVAGARVPAEPRLAGFSDYDYELRGASRAVITDLVLTERTLARGWYRPDGVRAAAEAHLARRENNARLLGMIATLEHWLRMLEERRDAAPARVRAAGVE